MTLGERVLLAITTIQAAVLAAALIVGAAVLFDGLWNPYQIAATPTDGNPAIWRLNKHTGEIVACTPVANPFAALAPNSRAIDRIMVVCADQ